MSQALLVVVQPRRLAACDGGERMVMIGDRGVRTMPVAIARLLPIGMLICSNVFMTFAWYGHLRFKDRPLWIVIGISWGIAFFEYCLAVPANRWGSGVYSAAELKAIQEVVTLSVFAVFSVLYLGQKISLVQGLGFALIAAGAFFVFHGAEPIH
jgi:uncharacterized protein (DUF486 family)